MQRFQNESTADPLIQWNPWWKISPMRGQSSLKVLIHSLTQSEIQSVATGNLWRAPIKSVLKLILLHWFPVATDRTARLSPKVDWDLKFNIFKTPPHCVSMEISSSPNNKEETCKESKMNMSHIHSKTKTKQSKIHQGSLHHPVEQTDHHKTCKKKKKIKPKSQTQNLKAQLEAANFWREKNQKNTAHHR